MGNNRSVPHRIEKNPLHILLIVLISSAILPSFTPVSFPEEPLGVETNGPPVRAPGESPSEEPDATEDRGEEETPEPARARAGDCAPRHSIFPEIGVLGKYFR